LVPVEQAQERFNVGTAITAQQQQFSGVIQHALPYFDNAVMRQFMPISQVNKNV
jgi:hypothetical protein